MKKLFFIATIFLFFCSNSRGAQKIIAGMVQKEGKLFAPGALIIKFKENVTVSQQGSGLQTLTPTSGIYSLDELSERFGVYNFYKLFPEEREVPPAGSKLKDLTRYYEINFPSELDLDSIAQEYKKDSNIESVELIPITRVDAISNDPQLGQQWHLIQGQDHDMDITEAWDHTVGDTNVILAIMDTGVLYSHPDLGGTDTSYTKGNIWINRPEYFGTPGIDDDGNGYIDDFRGWDWVNESKGWPGEDISTADNDPKDFNGHGTHLAGIAAGITNNGTGIAGIAGGWYDPNETRRGCRIMCLRIGWSAPDPNDTLFETGFIRMDYAASAMNYARVKGAIAFNCSWGSALVQPLADAINNALLNNIMIVKSAGNNGEDVQDYMNSIPDVTSVASSTSSDLKASFSNYGNWIDIAAPGNLIRSTYSNHYSPTYFTASGTSMSAPMVVGVAGLLKSKHPGLFGLQIEDLIKQYADSMPQDFHFNSGLLGAGRVNANNFLVLTPSAKFAASPRLGKTPLLVTFADSSTGTISSWNWNFGDASTSTLQNPTHTYNSPGFYSPKLTVSDPDFGIDTKTKTDYIVVVNDSVYMSSNMACSTSTKIKLTVSASNSLSTTGMLLPLRYGDGTAALICDSVNFAGSRLSFFDSLKVTVDTGSQTILLDLKSDSALGTGEGLITNLYFSMDSGAVVGESLFIDTAIVSGKSIKYTTAVGEYDPAYKSGFIEVFAYCRGDVTKSGDVSPGDLVFLINYYFKSGPAPDPFWLGDVTLDGKITSADIVYLINYIFKTGPPPP